MNTTSHKNAVIIEPARRRFCRTISFALLGVSTILGLMSTLDAGVAVRGPRGGGAAVNVGGVGRRAPVARTTTRTAARGTARRTTRRTMRRLYTLPRNHRRVAVAGVTYYVVEGVYYRPYQEGNQVVYVEVEVKP